MLVVGFVSAHVLDIIMYRPRQILERPLSLLYIWEGIGSFSGWIGALVGVVLWRRFETRPLRTFGPWNVGPWALGPITLSTIARRKEALPILPFADVVLSVFPVAWILGRTGCSVVHDHPGVRAADGAPFAVAFPSPDPSITDGPCARASFGPVTIVHGQYPRYDLGTIELVFTIALTLVFVLLWRRKLVTGTYAVIVCLVYPPARFLMDFLRLAEHDTRYAGLTPAQWLCIAVFLFGVVLLRRVLARRALGDPPAAELLVAPSPRVPSVGAPAP
jgi:phosphatidylglycerol:prolipoprotein diacylglycerol transferase